MRTAPEYLALIGLALIGVSGAFGYYLGLHASVSGESAAEYDLRGALNSHLAFYFDLRDGSPGLAREGAETFIEGDLATFEYYKKEYPGFGSNDPAFQKLLNQAKQVPKPEVGTSK